MRTSILFLTLAAALLSCAPAVPVQLAAPEPLPSPSVPGAGEPRLAVTPAGDVLMTWFEPTADGGQALRFARLEGEAWSAPVTITASDSFFVNWADFPAVVALDDTHLAVSYPWRSGEDVYAYDVMIRMSADGGATWGVPIRPHKDGTATEHGFVTLLGEAGTLRAVWLDGRNFANAAGHDDHDAGPGPEMTLRTALIDADGSLRDEILLDARVCDCCATAGAVTADGTVIAYRDRSDAEVRDISLVRLTDGVWSEPFPLHDDGWEIPGCPVNGPALAADDRGVAAVWYTQARDTAAVYAAFAAGGADFAAPVRVDGGDPLGRTCITMLEDGSAVVAWVEMASDTAEVRLRRVGTDGQLFEALTLARTSPRRSSGFPQIVRSGNRLVCAWTEAGTPSAVRIATVGLGRR